MAQRARTVLWVDDEVESLESHRRFLADHGFEVAAVAHGDDALEMLRRQTYGVVLLDEQMPGRRGLELVGAIRELDATVPVVMVTKSEDAAVMREAIGLSVDDYLVKPLQPRQVLSVVTRLLEGDRIRQQHLSREFVTRFRDIEARRGTALGWREWIDVAHELAVWDTRLAAAPEQGLQEALRSLGYSPGTDPNHPIPGSIQDLSSDARVDLVTQTLTDLARGRGKYELDRNPDRLEAWPAQELFRLIETRVQRNWAARWAAAGGSFYGGRMIALKDDEVWQNLGDGDGGYEDTLGLPYPPFAFNSGMWVEDVSREEAISLGLLAPEDVVEPNPERGWGEALQAGVNGLSQALQNVLLQLTPGARITDGILHFAANSEDLRGRVFKPSVLGLSPCTESP